MGDNILNYSRYAIKSKIALRRNVEFSRNADTTDQVCIFQDGVS